MLTFLVIVFVLALFIGGLWLMGHSSRITAVEDDISSIKAKLTNFGAASAAKAPTSKS